MPRVTLDGQSVEASPGSTILDAARTAGIVIPTLCHHPDLSPTGSCRLCMVEVEGHAGQLAACTTPASEGMCVRTESPALAESRRFVLEMLLLRYVDDGAAVADRVETEFERWVRHYGARKPEGPPAAPRFPVDADPNPFIRVDFNKCILCTRCVRACEEIQCRSVWGVGQRGDDARIIAGLDVTMLEARCESCGACVAYCPTGALDDRTSVGSGRPDRVVATICGYCGVGCGLNLNVKDDRIIRVTSDPPAPVNGMQLCVKGRYGYDYVHHPERLTSPRVRRYLLKGVAKAEAQGADREWVDVSWDAALALTAEKLAAVRRASGPDALGVLASAKCTNEENYLMQKFARQVLGTHNVDHCARLCHSSTVAGLAMAYGSGAMSNTLADVAERAAAAFVIGANVTEQHPVFGAMLRRAVRMRGMRLVVADPRRIDLTEFACLHLRHQPGTDVPLLNGMMHVILEEGWHDEAFIQARCEDFDAFREAVAEYPPDVAARICGVPEADIRRAAAILARHKPMAAIWAMGITQHVTGVMNVLCLANLQMLLGNLGMPGGGVNPLRGQNNVQGACDVGALPNLLPGYQSVTNASALAAIANAWALTSPGGRKEAEARPLSAQPGLTVTELVQAFGDGKLRALYVLGEDVAMTEPDVNHARHCLASGEFLVLQEIFPSETAAFADVLLPGAAFAEKAGTFTNTERRIQLVRPAVAPPGEAWQDWKITAELARRILALEGRTPIGPHASWTYDEPSRIMEEIAYVTPPYAGVSHARLERGEQLHWPVRDAAHPGTPILHVGAFPRGKGRFHAVRHVPAAELPDGDYPMILTTGRVLYHWHGGELSRRSSGLLAAYPSTLVEIHPDDAARVGLNGRRVVRVRSRRGEMIAEAVVTERVAPGVVFGNFHFPGPQNVNNLTHGAVDPTSKIPEYKVCAVAIEPLDGG